MNPPLSEKILKLYRTGDSDDLRKAIQQARIDILIGPPADIEISIYEWNDNLNWVIAHAEKVLKERGLACR